MKNFLKTKGYYVILAVCILATCAGGVVALTKTDKNNEEIPDYKDVIQDGGQTPVATDLPVMSSVTPEPSANPNESANPTAAPVQMQKPVDGEYLQDYAADKLVYNKTLQEWRTHKGIDIATEAGKEVVCPYTGTITDIKYDPRYGDTIVIDHGAGLTSVCCGVKPAEGVSVGRALEKGEALGNATGDVFCEKESGIHIHFEVMQDGKSVDPNLYFKK